ncbi:MAG: HAMP domain-containing histidine kinase [Cyclobacteriaceae bacterium]|nr:HAMP domain-containing histidine kinase [Cyclobacteriaceae bacterium]MCH8515550.1 HAMP domain-containing histidine kinase [Cyclobacteriaceae bacterium]
MQDAQNIISEKKKSGGMIYHYPKEGTTTYSLNVLSRLNYHQIHSQVPHLPELLTQQSNYILNQLSNAKAGTNHLIKFHLLDNNKEPVLFHTNCMIVPHDDDAVVWQFMVINNSVDTKAEQKLINSLKENFFIKNYPEPILLLNEQFELISANEDIIRLIKNRLGIVLEQKRSIFSAYRQNTNTTLLTLLQTLIENAKKNQSATKKIKLGNTSDNYFELSVRCVRESKTGLRYYIIVLKNISQEMIFKNKLDQQSEQLKITQADLDAIIYQLSHNIKGPLSTIEGLIQLLERDGGPMAETYLAMLRSNTKKLQKTVEKLAKVESNHILDSTRPLRFKDELSEVLRLYQDQIDTNSIEIQFDGDQFYTINYSKELLQTIFIELIDNSIMFKRKDQKLSVGIKLKEFNESIAIYYQDNGQGISSQVLPYIFNIFYRGNFNSKGSGLGLYLVKRLLDKMKAHIFPQSDGRSFTKFTILLPKS